VPAAAGSGTIVAMEEQPTRPEYVQRSRRLERLHGSKGGNREPHKSERADQLRLLGRGDLGDDNAPGDLLLANCERQQQG